MPLSSLPAWINPIALVEPISPTGVMATTPLQDERPEPSSAPTDETADTNPVVSTTDETIDTEFTVVVPAVLSDTTPGPSRQLATPRERSESQSHLSLAPRRTTRIVVPEPTVADEDLGPPDPFGDSDDQRLEPLEMDTVQAPAMEGPPSTQDGWSASITQGRLAFEQLAGLATEHGTVVHQNDAVKARRQECEGALHQCATDAARTKASLQAQVDAGLSEAVSLKGELTTAYNYVQTTERVQSWALDTTKQRTHVATGKSAK